MATFVTRQTIPLSTRYEIERILAIDAGSRDAYDTAFLAAVGNDYYNLIQEYDGDQNIRTASGKTVPDGLSGFAKGAIFTKIDATSGAKSLYENTGTTTTSSFNLIGESVVGDINLADGKTMIGNASGIAAAVNFSGDITVDNAGAATIAAGAIEPAMLSFVTMATHPTRDTLRWGSITDNGKIIVCTDNLNALAISGKTSASSASAGIELQNFGWVTYNDGYNASPAFGTKKNRFNLGANMDADLLLSSPHQIRIAAYDSTTTNTSADATVEGGDGNILMIAKRDIKFAPWSAAEDVEHMYLKLGCTNETIFDVDTHAYTGGNLTLNTLSGGLQINGTTFTGGVAGTGISLNKTANTGGTMKIHCHQLTAGSTLITDQVYANEFKGEFLDTTGTMDGITAHFHMGASSSGIMRSILGVAYLDSGFTLSGTDYTNSGWLNAGTFVADASGVVNGTGVVIAGLYAGIGSCQTGTLTEAKYLTSLWVTSNRLTTLTTGQSSLILVDNPTGTDKKLVNYGIRMEAGDGLITTGISLSGDYTTGLEVGSSAAKLALGATGDRLINAYSTSSLATAVNVSSATISQTMTGASTVNTSEALQVVLSSAVQMGNWANAIAAKIDLTTTGYVTGLAGVVCAELDMPSTGPAGSAGTYTCYEAEINMAGATDVPVSAITINAWGAEVASFDTNGYIMDLNLTAAATGKVFQANTAADATHALRIRINGVPYYMMLTTVGA